MKELPNLLIIGGSGRNVGKTTLIINLINKFHTEYSIIGLKVTSIRPGEQEFHGKHEFELKEDFEIFEEHHRDGIKDTSKMLIAGATKVFYIRAFDESIPIAFNLFLDKIPEKSMIICESISLRKYVKPGLFVMIKQSGQENIKQRAEEMMNLADLNLTSDGKTFDHNMNKLTIRDYIWMIN